MCILEDVFNREIAMNGMFGLIIVIARLYVSNKILMDGPPIPDTQTQNDCRQHRHLFSL